MNYTMADTSEGQRLGNAERRLNEMLNDPHITPEIQEKLELLVLRLDLLTDWLLEVHRDTLTTNKN